MAARFCAQCGAELTTRVESGRERPACPRCGSIVYRNPVPVAVVRLIHDSKMLLLLRRNPPLAHYWAPPAGYVEIDESLEEGAAREVREETSLQVAVDRLVTVHSAPNAGVVLVLFDAHRVGGELAIADEEAVEVKWFAPSDLPYQAPPQDGSAMELLFYRLLGNLFEEFRERRAVG